MSNASKTNNETNDVIINDSNGVRTIQFNRLSKKNAITHAMYRKMASAIREGDNGTKIRVIVFRGHEGCFSAGADLVDFQNTAAEIAKTGKPRVLGDQAAGDFLDAISNAPTPLVAVVDGFAVGIGVTLLLHCDLVYASKTSTFHTPFTALGLVPEAGSSQIMPRMMGHAQAAELLMLGQKINAKTAQRLGILTRTYKAKKLEKRAAVAIKTLSELPPASVRASKALMKGQSQPIAQRMAKEGAEFSARLSSEEFTEASAAFRERRKPDFSKYN